MNVFYKGNHPFWICKCRIEGVIKYYGRCVQKVDFKKIQFNLRAAINFYDPD